ncbi:chitinase-3-like protein 2 [Heterocephalus glaber]|uniref:Chitinase-3-like protein 2 n=1 Tax=Heterocephalus glaber TaxID=10181 RepID=A0AAX6TL06_HETGA|nr:chitinase-3-like protein 2 [Heterocephalus glaber]
MSSLFDNKTHVFLTAPIMLLLQERVTHTHALTHTRTHTTSEDRMDLFTKSLKVETVLALVLKHHDGAAYKLVCYFSNWAHSLPAPASVLPCDLEPFLCTHLIFAFASMSNNQIVAKDLQDEKILHSEFNRLKERCVRVGCELEFSDFTDVRELNPLLLLF